MTLRYFRFVTATIAVLVCATGPSLAKIKCDGEYQVNSGARIATPYCQDAYLAQVARSYGSRVTAEAIRQSVSTKQSICQFIGADIRVKTTCEGYRDDFRR